MTDATRARSGLRPVWVVLRKEFLDNVRNRWILALSAIFVILTLAMSYFGATQTGGGVGFQGLEETGLLLLGVAIILVPILSLMLAYGAVVGEKERGSMQLLLAMPLTRREAFLGKFLGLGAVLAVAILAGLGSGGLVIMAAVGLGGWEEYLALVLGAILFALAFLSIGLLLSTLARRRSTALGGTVGLWFLLVLLYDLIWTGVYVATGGSFVFVPGGTTELPDWFYYVTLANPTDAYGFFASSVTGLTSGFGFSYTLPSFVNVWTTTFVIAFWAVVPLLVSLWRFQRQDI